MQVTHHAWYSPHLSKDMGLNHYGQQGQPVLAFPAQEGNHRNFEDFGMIAALRPLIESGAIQLFTVDSVDGESWTAKDLHPRQRGLRYEAYVRYILDEVLPFIRHHTDKPLWTTGVSMGGYHAANFLFRFPHAFGGCIVPSAVYALSEFINDYMDDLVYYNSPLLFLPNLEDPYYLDELKRKVIVLAVGQGAWEEPMLTQTRQMAEILRQKNIPAWIDIWGPDVHHDWPWWHKQLPYFLEKLLPTLSTS
jgi:esterase/lipase superfamily enzyme